MDNLLVETAVQSFQDLLALRPTLKPAANEWTNFAAIIISHSPGIPGVHGERESLESSKDSGYLPKTPPESAESWKCETISLATGTKCLSAQAMSPWGDLLNDSHAEVLARRGLIWFLYQELYLALENRSDVVEMHLDGRKLFSVKEGIRFHFVISHTPCGDASIFPVQPEDRLLIEKRVKRQDANDPPAKRQKFEEDIHRTGAKCVPDSNFQDSHQPGQEYHIIGALRTKPGRGYPTLSMSCSDKIMKWNVLGLQGTLLRLLMEPVYLNSIVIAKCPFDLQRVKESLINRSEGVSLPVDSAFLRHFPIISQSELIFPYGKYEADFDASQEKKPCPKSVVWIKRKNLPNSIEILVNGKKQGASGSGQKILASSARSILCKLELFKLFRELLAKLPIHPSTTNLIEESAKNPSLFYEYFKNFPSDYRDCRGLFMHSFPLWTKKPSGLLNFPAQDVNDVSC